MRRLCETQQVDFFTYTHDDPDAAVYMCLGDHRELACRGARRKAPDDEPGAMGQL